MRAALIIVAGMISAPACAQEWVHVGDSAKGTVFYYDNTSIRAETGRRVLVWTKQDEAENKAAPESYSLKRFRLDCSSETIALLYWGTYDGKGVVIDSNTVPTYQQSPSPIVPGSIGMSLYEAICPRVRG